MNLFEFLSRVWTTTHTIEDAKMEETEVLMIAVEGNIGAGKTELMNYIISKRSEWARQLPDVNIVVVKEPVDEWTAIKDHLGHSVLERYYENPERHAFTFQMMVYLTRMRVLRQAYRECMKNSSKKMHVIISERSLVSDECIFMQHLDEMGCVNDFERHTYNLICEEFRDMMGKNVRMVYLRASPEVCYARIQKRRRDGEDDIAMGYLLRCHELHEELMEKTRDVVVVDADVDIADANYASQINAQFIQDLLCK
jgi:deoxyadenosine/deoxycytidine kinase